jgi:serine-type D-Ala-D-Ala carboxypeptidase/endopeptidase
MLMKDFNRPALLFLFIFCVSLTFKPKLSEKYKISSDTILDSVVNREGLKFVKDSTHVSLAIGIYDKGKIYTYGFGSTNKHGNVLPTANTIFELGSITKTFTGILLAQAVVDRKLRLNDEVSRYLGGKCANLTFKKAPVRIIHLANHTSGLPKNLTNYQGLSPEQILKDHKSYSEQKFLDALRKIVLTKKPRTSYSYSNADIQLLGIILEKVYGLSYAELVNKLITTPNHMEHTRLTSDAGSSNVTHGYNADGQQMPFCDQWKSIPAAGYLTSSVNDMLKYIQLNIEEGSNAAVSLSHQPTFFRTDEDSADIGLCWFSKSVGGYKQISHAGGTFGTTSFCLIIPELKKGVICFANDTGPTTEKELREMSQKILVLH